MTTTSKVLFAAVLVLFTIAFSLTWKATSATPALEVVQEVAPATQNQDQVPAQVNQEQNTQVAQESTPVQPVETPKKPSGISMAVVAQHATAESCYTVINGTVYDVTSFIEKHPGGSSKILKLCGIDGTERFMNQHGGGAQQEKTLASFKIDTLMQ